MKRQATPVAGQTRQNEAEGSLHRPALDAGNGNMNLSRAYLLDSC